MIVQKKTIFVFMLMALAQACAITASRPVQAMSDAEAAVRAAREVNAQSLAAEIYRKSSELLAKARREYRLKQFKTAKKHADEARDYAERAEYEAIRAGGNRQAVPEDPLAEPVSGDASGDK
jgi:hypothetical protein